MPHSCSHHVLTHRILYFKMDDHNQTKTAAEALDIAHEINKILDCGLDKESLSICIALLETGVNPEALAEVIQKLRKEAAKVRKVQEEANSALFPPQK